VAREEEGSTAAPPAADLDDVETGEEPPLVGADRCLRGDMGRFGEI